MGQNEMSALDSVSSAINVTPAANASVIYDGVIVIKSRRGVTYTVATTGSYSYDVVVMTSSNFSVNRDVTVTTSLFH